MLDIFIREERSTAYFMYDNIVHSQQWYKRKSKLNYKRQPVVDLTVWFCHCSGKWNTFLTLVVGNENMRYINDHTEYKGTCYHKFCPFKGIKRCCLVRHNYAIETVKHHTENYLTTKLSCSKHKRYQNYAKPEQVRRESHMMLHRQISDVCWNKK